MALPEELLVEMCKYGGASLYASLAQANKRLYNLTKFPLDALLQPFLLSRISLLFPNTSTDHGNESYWWGIQVGLCGSQQTCVSTRNLRGRYIYVRLKFFQVVPRSIF